MPTKWINCIIFAVCWTVGALIATLITKEEIGSVLATALKESIAVAVFVAIWVE